MSMTSTILTTTHFEFIIRCLVSMILGGFIGFERAYKQKPAGVKTHILICMGATVITFMSFHFSTGGDPGRIAAQIVSGIGFIGGGAILHSNKIVQGLTTASTLWASAALGMLVGAGLIFPAIFFTMLCLFVLLISNRFSRTRTERRYFSLVLEINDVSFLPEIEKMTRKYELSLESKRLIKKKELVVEISYISHPLSHHLFMKKLLLAPGISSVLAI